MSLQADHRILCVLILGLICGASCTNYEHNPFLQHGTRSYFKNSPKDLTQINVALIVPPGQQISTAGEKPPSPPAPGYIWVQVPVSNEPVKDNKPLVQPFPPTPTVSVTQPPPPSNVYIPSTPAQPTKEPAFTIEPPGVLLGSELSSRCLQPKGQFPSTTCNKYVNCWDGIAIEQSCPGDLLFNPARLYCDYPANVDCQGKVIAVDPTPSPVAPAPVDPTSSTSVPSVPQVGSDSSQNTGPNPELLKLCLRSVGLFPGSTCGKFVNCWDGNVVEQDCPEGLQFNPEGYCDYPEKVGCGSSTNENNEITDNFFSNLHADLAKRECPLEFGNFRNRTDCSRYYVCAYNKVAAEHVCPEGLSFSDKLGICDYSDRVDCSKEPQIYQKTTVNNNDVQTQEDLQSLAMNAFAHSELSKPVELDSRCTVSQGLVRDRYNCSTYHVCDSGFVVSTYVCPTGYKFSNELGVCDFQEKVRCDYISESYDQSATILGLPDISQDILARINKCVPGSIFRLNPQCTTACICRNGVAEIVQCTNGLGYDSTLDKCVPMNIARC